MMFKIFDCCWVGTILIIFFFAVYILQKYTTLTLFHLRILFPIFFMIVIVFMPFLILLICIFAIYRQIIHLILANKHGSKYGGLLPGSDALFGTEAYKKECICSLLIIKYNHNKIVSFHDMAKKVIYESITTTFSTNAKVLGHLQRYLGYYYILKNQVTIDECFNTFETPEPVDKDGILKVASDYFNKPLPCNHRALWEVSIGTQPLKWKDPNESDDVAFYPVLFKYHHVLADGNRILTALQTHFSDGNSDVNEKLESAKSENFTQNLSTPTTNVWFNIKMFLIQIYCAFSFCTKNLLNLVMLGKTNALHGSTLSYEKHYLLRFMETTDYIKRIKVIKSHISGSSFTDILLTAVSCSLGKYLEQQSTTLPKYIVMTLPEISMKFLAHINSGGHLSCGNTSAFSTFRIPIFTNATASIIERVQEVRKEVIFFRNPIEIAMNRILLNTLFCFIPHPLSELMMKMMGITVIVSNVIGPPATPLKENCFVNELLTFPINRELTGLALILLTFNNKLRFLFTVDKAIISNEKEALSILDGIYDCLDMLYDECISISK